MRPIDADALENALLKVKDFAPELCGRPIIKVTDMIDIIRKMPTADVAPIRRGRWIENYDIFKCSECGALGPFEEDYSKPYRCNFCPNCGANMREIEEND